MDLDKIHDVPNPEPNGPTCQHDVAHVFMIGLIEREQPIIFVGLIQSTWLIVIVSPESVLLNFKLKLRKTLACLKKIVI